MNLSRQIYLALLWAGLIACSPGAERLTFTPQAGDTREYQVLGDSEVEAETPYGLQTERIETRAVLRYHARTAREIELQPGYMQINNQFGRFSSADTADRYNEDLHEWMDGGFLLTLNRDGSTHSFRANLPLPDRFDSDTQPDPLLDFVQNELTQPGTLSGLRLQAGAKMTLEEQPSGLSPVEVEVQRITGDEVFITLNAQSQQERMYGLIVFERQSGWLVRAVVVTETEFTDEQTAVTGLARSRVSIVPSDASYAVEYDYLAQAYELPAETRGDLTDIPAMGETLSDPFLNSSGELDYFNTSYQLNYDHPGLTVDTPLTFQARDARAFTVDGESLDLDLSIGAAYLRYGYGSDALQTGIPAYPLGWFGVDQQSEKLGYIELTLDAYRNDHEVVDIPLADAPLTIQHGESSLTLEQGEESGHYLLRLSPRGDVNYGYTIGRADYAMMRLAKAENVPDWLDDAERRMFAIIDRGNFPMEFDLIFADEEPQSVQLTLTQTSPELYASRRLRFYDPDRVLDKPYLPLPRTFYLYPEEDGQWEDDWQIFADSRPRIEFTPADTADMRPNDTNPAQLFWTLTPEQAASCSLIVNDERFVWQERSDIRLHRRTDGQLSPLVIYQLQGAHSGREYFYDESVEVSADCAASVQWQAVEKPDSMEEHPWLVPLSALHGIEPDSRVTDALRQYRFTDADGRALALMPASSEPRTAPFEELRIREMLIDNQWLRAGGEVAQIEVLQAAEERIEQRYLHHFPVLPEPTGGGAP